ncbi:MAG: hypothetical protein ACTSUJ_03470, partial [Candidatus Njordarchaeales archaeon]
EAPMSWVPRRSVSADGCPWEGMTCAMRGRYSSSSIAKFGNTYPQSETHIGEIQHDPPWF